MIETTAAASGRDPIDLPPLYGAVDPDALDALVGTAAGDRSPAVEVRFDYAGYRITVRGDGDVCAVPGEGAHVAD